MLVLVLRGLEFLAKLSHTLSSVKKVVDGVHSRSKIKDLPWPAFDVEELRKLLVDSRIALLRILGKLVPILSLLPDDTSLPDDFGACYVHVLEVAFSGLIQDDDAQFKEFFPSRFAGDLRRTTSFRNTSPTGTAMQLSSYGQTFLLIFLTWVLMRTSSQSIGANTNTGNCA